MDDCFEPEFIQKGQTRIDGTDDSEEDQKTVWGLFSRRTIGLYAAGLSTRDIRAHLEEVYGLKVSADLIICLTDAVLAEVSDWQNRALGPMYPIVFLAALRVKIRDAESRQVKNKAVYVALGVAPEGEREVPGLWIANNEGARFWLSVMNNLRNIRHCRPDQWRNMAHRRGHPDRRCPISWFASKPLPGNGRPQGLS
ncbi:MAG: hypothetical protein ACJA1E_001378 [Paracoccaceae bacterium]|jgi:putative transposase